MRSLAHAAVAAALLTAGLAGCALVGQNMSATFQEIADRHEQEARRTAEPDPGAVPTEAPAVPSDPTGAEGASEAPEPQAETAVPDDPAAGEGAPATTAPPAEASATGATQDLTARCEGLTEPACRGHRACGWTDGACIPAPPRRR